MLDIQGLPKNANGFRTTHTCELCGFEPKTKNKYREKQDHLVMKHFKEQIDKIFPHCRPYSCPNTECSFEGKDKQALLRHYTGKHGVLELYLKEALLAKGINYHLSDSAKRKSMNNPNSEHKAKMARLSPGPALTVLPDTAVPVTTILPLPPSPEQVLAQADTTTILPSDSPVYSARLGSPEHEYSVQQVVQYPAPGPAPAPHPAPAQLRLPTVPTTKLPSMSTLTAGHRTKPVQLEVDALIASFEPQDYQVSATVQYSASPLATESEQIVSSTTSPHQLDPPLPTLYLPPGAGQEQLLGSKLPLILDNNIMWSSGSTAIPGVTDPAQTVPAVFDSSDSAFINLGDIDYDYLYPATVDPAIVQATVTQAAAASPSSQNVLPFTDL